MTKKELLEKAIYWFRVIAEDMGRITSGNLPHNSATTKGRAIRAYEFLEKHKNDEDNNLWKPSEEQMKALNYVVNLMASSESPKKNDYYYNVFKDLREQLKKLNEK